MFYLYFFTGKVLSINQCRFDSEGLFIDVDHFFELETVLPDGLRCFETIIFILNGKFRDRVFDVLPSLIKV